MEIIMAVKCLKCGYEMSTWQEAMSALSKRTIDKRPPVEKVFAGHLNTGSNAVPCPKCGAKGHFEDC
jgi:predicted nucleic-acid-binding Zn-ribbon protein